MYKTPLSQEEQLSDLHDQYGWSMDEIEVVVALTMNEMIEIFGECCEEYDRGCSLCRCWEQWQLNGGKVTILLSREDVIKAAKAD